jgi:hypothetical protein
METKSNKLVLNQETLKNLTSNEAATKARADNYFKSLVAPPFCTPVGGMN